MVEPRLLPLGVRFTCDGSAMPSCPAMKSSTSPGTSSGSSRNVPSHRTVVSCSAKPALMCSPRCRPTSSRSSSSRKNTRSRSACDGGPAYRPYAAACSSDKYSCGTTRHRRRSPAGYPVVRPNRGRLIQLSPARHPRRRRGAGLSANFRAHSPKTRIRRGRGRRRPPLSPMSPRTSALMRSSVIDWAMRSAYSGVGDGHRSRDAGQRPMP